MPIYKHFRPNYCAIYKDVELTDEVLDVLRRSDRKMEYMEYDLKHSHVRKVRGSEETRVIPPREASLERLLEQGQQFASDSPPIDQSIFEQENMQVLAHSLSMLDADERSLIKALFYDGLTEREYAVRIDRAQQSVNERKFRILNKLKTAIERLTSSSCQK